jgi:hypothetical protein
MGRAKTTPGLMKEDRIALLRDASKLIEGALDRYSADKPLYRTYFDVGFAIADPEMSRMISRAKARATGGIE